MDAVNMDGWDVAILIVAGYIALITMIRLMAARRDSYMRELHSQIQQERQRRRKAEDAAKKGAGKAA